MKNKRLKIIVIGASGRTGRFVVNKIIKNNNLQLINPQNKKIQSKNIDYKLVANCDVIIDFSIPKLTLKILTLANKLKKKSLLEQLALITNKTN
jgi:dihydrodipicolinate reductase